MVVEVMVMMVVEEVVVMVGMPGFEFGCGWNTLQN